MSGLNSGSDKFREIIRIIGRGRKLQRDLTREEAFEAMRLILSGECSEAQIGAFLVTMRVKEETVDEIIGFVQAAREAMLPFRKPQVDRLVDLALPYDGKSKHLQTSVAVGLILAAAGIPVVLHGADDVPTKRGVGVLNLLRALDYPVDASADAVSHDIELSNFGVLNIGRVLPRWMDLTPIRHHFGLRTLMNTVEKLSNPMDAPYHISGFYHNSYLVRMASALPGRRANWIIQGEEGGIDIRPGKKTRVYRSDGDAMVEMMIDAHDYGFAEVIPLEMPDDVQAHADVMRRVLEEEPGPAADQIALTSGTLLWMLEAVGDIADGVDCARSLLSGGQARAILERKSGLQAERPVLSNARE